MSSWRWREVDNNLVCSLAQSLALPETVARVLVGRGATSLSWARSFMDKSLQDLESPLLLSGMTAAAKRLAQAIAGGECILVHGDFDADGITAAALASLFIKDLGGKVVTFIPNRLSENHGISTRAIDVVKAQKVSVLMTCDCGSSDLPAIEALRALGVDVIVTDHHELGNSVDAHCIMVNPQLSPKGVCLGLSGVGVVFMVMVALRGLLRDDGFFDHRAEPRLVDYLDIVALGTIADMAVLTGQNRILVSRGLMQLQLSSRPGLLAMRDLIGLPVSSAISAEDVGYRLAPRLNAAARLGHTEDALGVLMTSDPLEALAFARRLEGWNQERRKLQDRMFNTASVSARQQVDLGRHAIVVADASFHPGIIGLVAQKLAQTYGRPAFVGSVLGDTTKISARSRGEINLMSVLHRCAAFFSQYGGHKEAGGAQLQTTLWPQVMVEIEQAVSLQERVPVADLWIDGEVSLQEVNSQFLGALDRLGPFGMGNPEPVFSGVFRVIGQPIEVGQGHLKIRLQDLQSPTVLEAMGFGLWGLHEIFQPQSPIQVAFTPENNYWNGQRTIRLRLKDAQPWDAEKNLSLSR